MKPIIVAISREPHTQIENTWRQKGYNVVWRVNGIKVDPNNTLDRVKAVADERNLAMKQALEVFPDATDVFMVDSYYADQYESCDRLIKDYELTKPVILAGAIWGQRRTHASHLVNSKKWFVDTWGFPECRFIPYGWRPENEAVVWGNGAKVPMPGFYRVESVGSAYLFPIESYYVTWYRPCEDLSRTEHYYLCRQSGLKCYVDFNAPFYRTGAWYSPMKCLRTSIGEARRKVF